MLQTDYGSLFTVQIFFVAADPYRQQPPQE
jgi:hypothetical protein